MENIIATQLTEEAIKNCQGLKSAELLYCQLINQIGGLAIKLCVGDLAAVKSSMVSVYLSYITAIKVSAGEHLTYQTIVEAVDTVATNTAKVEAAGIIHELLKTITDMAASGNIADNAYKGLDVFERLCQAVGTNLKDFHKAVVDAN